MNRVRRWRALPIDERRASIAAAWRLAAVHALLAIAGVPWTRKLLVRRANGIDHALAERAARAVQRAANHLPLRTNCLDRALALSWLLASGGIASTLRIGVRKTSGDTLAAHAWVEHDGAVLLDEIASDYLPLAAANE
jgi:hypothetical protein